jgi:hypothetical protein
MLTFERVHFTASELRGFNETEKFLHMAQRLSEIGLNGPNMLYCGIEGLTLLDGQPEDKAMTFAVSYKKVMAAAHEIDENGSTFEGGYPLYFATRPDVVVPAIAVYDRGELVPQHPEEDNDWDWLEEWVCNDGKSVNAALRAVLFTKP